MSLNALASWGKQIDPRIVFWKNRYSWPEDSKDHAFAARAILELGRAEFGASWSDGAPETQLAWELPGVLSLYTPIDEIRRGVFLLRAVEGPYAARTRGETLLSSRDEFPTSDEWALAVTLAKEQFEASGQSFYPFIQVGERLADACRKGLVQTATRPLEGGELSEKDWHFWNSERLWRRFQTCRIDENAPFTATRVVEGGVWLFIERRSFEAFKSGQSTEASPATAPTSAMLETALKEATLKEEARPRRRAGRPTTHDWSVMAIEFGRLLEQGSMTESTSTRRVAQLLLDWAATKWERLPELSTVEDQVRHWRNYVSESD